MSAINGRGELADVGGTRDINRDACNVASGSRVVSGAGEATDGEELINVYVKNGQLLFSEERSRAHTLQVIAVGVVIVALALLGLVHAARAESRILANVEALVGADALVLEVMLVPVVVGTKVDVALVRELANWLADFLARRGDIVHVEIDLAVDGEDKLGNGQNNGASVLHDGDVRWGFVYQIL